MISEALVKRENADDRFTIEEFYGKQARVMAEKKCNEERVVKC